MLNPNDPSAVLGVDDPAQVVQTFQNTESEMNVEMKNVTMAVVDGIVVGTKVFYICSI